MAEGFIPRLLLMKTSFTRFPSNAHSARQKHQQPTHTGEVKASFVHISPTQQIKCPQTSRMCHPLPCVGPVGAAAPGSAVAAMNRSAPAQIITALGNWAGKLGTRARTARASETASAHLWCPQLIPVRSELCPNISPHSRRAAGHSPHCCGQDDTGVVAEVGNGCLSQQQVSQDVAPKAVQHGTEPGGKRALPGHLHGSCGKNWESRSHQWWKGPSRASQ